MSPRACGVAAMLGVVWLAGAVLALMYGAAGSGLDWTRHYVSDFANGPRGWILPLGILGHASGNVALALGLYRTLQRGALRNWAMGLFLLADSGLALTGLFAVDAPGAAPSAGGTIHRAAASASFVLELAALVLFSAAFAREARWRSAAAASLVLSALGGAASAMLFPAVALGWRPGLAERLALVPFMAWEFWAGARLARRALPVRAASASPTS